MDDSPLAGLAFSLVGPGRVGTSLAHWACTRGARLVQVAGRRTSKAPPWVESLGAEWALAEALDTRKLDLLLLALPDANYDDAVRRIADRPPSAVVLHTSGSQDVSILDPLRAIGAETGSIHPLKAFPRPLVEVTSARDVFFALDGVPTAVHLGERLVSAWGGRSAVIEAPLRLLYHSAATLAAGGVATLMAAVWQLAHDVDLPDAVWEGYVNLARGALEAVESAQIPARAITGPAARGDQALIDRELAALAAVDPRLEALARLLWRTTEWQHQLHPQVPTPRAEE